MFDFMDMFSFGRIIEAHGEKWQSLMPFVNRYHLAIRVGQTIPAQCFVVQEDERVAPSEGVS